LANPDSPLRAARSHTLSFTVSLNRAIDLLVFVRAPGDAAR